MPSDEVFHGTLAKYDPNLVQVEDSYDLEEEGEHVLLICGDCPQARALADLADKCGFVVDVAVQTSLEAEAGNFPKARHVQALPGFDNLIQACGIGRSHYVCIFAPDEESCLNALSEAIESHAFYIGVWASPEERGELFAQLRAIGVPDAELAPICCPIGLSVYAENPEQAAVAVVAELLAARAGTLGRLRLDD